MIYVGIDVAKDKHDCFITSSDGEVLLKPFTIPNNREGLETLFQRIESVSDGLDNVKVGLEATEHSSIASHMPVKSLELKHTIKLIQELTTEIDEVEASFCKYLLLGCR